MLYEVITGKAGELEISGHDQAGNIQETNAFSIESDQSLAKGEDIDLYVTLVKPSQIKGGLKAAWLYENAGDPLDKNKAGARITSYNVCYTKLLRSNFGCDGYALGKKHQR